MSYVKAMVDYFEELSVDKRLSLSPLSNKDESKYQNQIGDEDDDDLLSYGSDDDIGTEVSPLNHTSIVGNTSNDQLDASSSTTQIVRQPNSSVLEIDDDDHTLVYSSDESTNTTENITIFSPQQIQSNDKDWISTSSTPKITNTEKKPDDENNNIRSTIDIVNDQGQSPLTMASISCLYEVMKMFISEGCDVNINDSLGISPLHYVCMNTSSHERLNCLQLLLENGANVNCQDDQGSTPLHRAVAHDCSESIKTLLVNGGCPYIQDALGNTALHEATTYRHIEIIKMLAEVKTCSKPFCPCKLTRPSTLLIESLDEESDIDYSPKFQSESCPPPNTRSLEIWNRFFENAAYSSNLSFEEKSEIEYCTSLHDAIAIGDDDCIHSLLDQGKDINETDQFGNTPLHLAAQRGDLQLLIMLVENGAEVNCKNNNDETPRSLCIDQRCADYLHCHDKDSNMLIQSFDLVHGAFNFATSIISMFTSVFFRRRESFATTPIPEDVAAALLEAKANNKLMIGQLEPPIEVKMALEKAGLK